ncbi:hypothetical protein AB0G73_33885 [Streptomyces sp. NPDC020719]|uniref:hypothetical protein n=1 Tax=Streptomyces sp. NPDC020719 TaxID=3154896 RepID=UPI0033CC908C
MEHGSGGTAPGVSLTHVVAVYEATGGRVVHLHHVVVLEGGQRIEQADAEREALQKAQGEGHAVSGLRTHYVTRPLPREPGVLHFDVAAGTVIAKAAAGTP